MAPALVAFIALLISTAAGLAQQAQQPERTLSAREVELQEAVEGAIKAAQDGPAVVPLIDQGELRLPEGYVFLPRAEAGRLLRALGNLPGPNLLGILLAQADGLRWFAVLSYNGVGYIKDDEAKDWNADELLAQLRAGTDEGNEDRVARGFAPIEVAGWVERPLYSASTHRLVWSAMVRDKGASADSDTSVNYNTYALGREGYLQLNLVTSSASVAQDKAHAGKLLDALAYSEGKRYEDFQPGTDRVAAYGLAALVAGAAAKKLGFLALMLAFIVKSWKLVLLGLIGVGALLAKLRGSRRT